MLQSIKDYITALGYWGWLVLADVLSGSAGAYLDISGCTGFPTWLWILLLSIGLVFTPFLAFHKIRMQRDKLQAEIDSQKSEVELTNFHQELQYNVTTIHDMPMIVIRLVGILRNTSMRNHGSLDFFHIEIPTHRGFFQATCNNIPPGYKFEPNSLLRQMFIFAGESDEPSLYIQSENPDVKVQPWEPLIKGAKGRITLAVQGQEIKTYPIKIADIGGFA